MQLLRARPLPQPGGMDASNAAGGSIPADSPTHDSAPADGSTSADMSGESDATLLWAVLKMQRIWRGRHVRAESDLGAAFWKVVAEVRPPKPSAGKRVVLGGSAKRSPKKAGHRIAEGEASVAGKGSNIRTWRNAARIAGKGSNMRSWGTAAHSAARQSLVFSREPKQSQQNALSGLLQGWGDDAGLGIARLVDDVLLSPLVYRLVALNPGKTWGTGKLVQLAEKAISDDELAQELSALLLRPWTDDPTRAYALKEKGWSPTDTGAGGETWRDVLLEGRGSVGETVLHLAFLVNTPACRRLVRFLVPFLANEKTSDLFGHKVGTLDATYLGQPYFGEVAAHFAIVHEDLPMLKLLVAHGASVTARASGDFFYSSHLVYFGGTLLGFAACLDNKPIVEYLLTNERARANPNGRDLGAESKREKRVFEKRGGDDSPALRNERQTQTHMHRNNTILHCLVMHERAHMYRYLVNHGANPYSINCMNQTPMLLAVAMGSRKMVSTAMEATQVVAWTFGPMKCVEVPLYEVESIKETKVIAEEQKGRQPAWAFKQPKTILQLIESESQADLLCTPHAAQPDSEHHRHSSNACLSRGSADIDFLWMVVKAKWDCFACSIFLYFVMLNSFSLISQTLALCTTLDADRCTGVVYLFVVPVPIEDMPAIIGDVAYFTTLFLSLLLLCREFTTSRTLGKTWRQTLKRSAPELAACLFQWYGETA
jgi:hypothetical protein